MVPSPFLEPGERVLQHLGLFAEREPYLRAPGLRIVVEHGVGNGDHAGLVRQAPAELDAVRGAELPDVGGDEVRALGRVDAEARLRQAGAQAASA